MVDVMEERIHSIERTAGFAFVLASVILGTTMLIHPIFPDVNKTGAVLQAITGQKGEAWMQVHAVMAGGFAIAAVAFCAFAFLLHLKGSSGSGALVSTCALLGAGIWVTFLCAETYAYRFFTNLYGIDAAGATMLFSVVWFWKLGAVSAGAVLLFAAVIFAGIGAVKRDLLPLWLGWGGALFGLVGALVYIMDFWGTTATGAASQPMQWPLMRYGVGLPIQLWMLGVGVILLQRYFARPMRMRTAPARVGGEHVVRRAPQPAASSGSHQAPTGEPSRPSAPRVPHPAFAPDPEPQPPMPPGQGTGTDAPTPKRPAPPQIFPG